MENQQKNQQKVNNQDSSQEEEKLSTRFQNLSLKNNKNQAKNQKLYVDILGFTEEFLKTKNYWDLDTPFQEIKKFVEAAQNSNIQLEIFIDGSATTRQDQSFNRWQKSRLNEVENCKKGVPAGWSNLLGDMFKKLNIKVNFSCYEEKCNVIASYAEKFSADILTNFDGIATNYPEATFTVFKQFKIEESSTKLILIKHEFQNYYSNNQYKVDNSGKKWQLILDPLPQVSEFNSFPELQQEKPEYIRGTPTALVKYFGNAHKTLKTLRQAYYFHLKIKQPVKEMYPEFDEKQNKAIFVEDSVSADEAKIHLLKDHFQAVEEYFLKKEQKPQGVSELIWNNHLFNVHATTFELCSLYQNCSLLSLLEQCEQAKNAIKVPQTPNYVEIECRNCRNKFKFSESEQQFYQEKNFDWPKKCKKCRQQQKNFKQQKFQN